MFLVPIWYRGNWTTRPNVGTMELRFRGFMFLSLPPMLMFLENRGR